MARKNKKIDGIEGYDYLVCNVCGTHAKELASHYKRYHPDVDVQQPSKCQKICDFVKGENNPGYQHGGKLSPFSKKFVKYESEETRKASLKKQGETRKKNGTNPFTREFYETDKEFTKAQTRDLAWFIEKFGEDEGKKNHQAKTEKWMKSFKKVNFSKISQELFDEIMKKYNGDVYYATYDRCEMRDYKNKEFILKLATTYCRPDFICLQSRKVIEFDGEYWHSEAIANPAREKERDELISEQGLEILHVKEHDYKNDKLGTIEKCINFLTQ